MLGSLFDGVARHTQEGLDFVARAQDAGFRQAVRERDDPFGDYGSRPRGGSEGARALSEVTSYETGVPCWVDAQSSDLPTTVDFYCALFGWDDEDQGEEAGHYTMFRRKGLEVAAIFPLMAEGTQPRWTTYLATDDLDETAAKVQAAGGVVFQGPIDIFDSGRMAIVADPTGTVFGVWEARSTSARAS